MSKRDRVLIGVGVNGLMFGVLMATGAFAICGVHITRLTGALCLLVSTIAAFWFAYSILIEARRP